MHEHHFVEKLFVDLSAEIVRVDRFLADMFAGGVIDRYGQHDSIHFPVRGTDSMGIHPPIRCPD